MINFQSKIDQKVLVYFLLNPESEMYLNEMAKKFAVDRGNLARKLERWRKEGIIAKRKRGNLSLYRINKKYPLLPEMKKIARKTFGLEAKFKQVLEKIKGLKMAVVFGSYAIDKLDVESDVDILLVGSHDFLKTQKEIVKLQKFFDREINAIDMTEKEFKRKKNSDLIRDIFRKKHIKLI
jgi:predicted nucleotidyltransferase